MWSQSTTVIHLFVFIFLQNMYAIFTLNLLALTRITRFTLLYIYLQSQSSSFMSR